MIKLYDVVEYTGDYKVCHGFKYKITHIWKNMFGIDWWYNIEAVEKDFTTHFPEIFSVEKKDIKRIN